MTNVASRRRLLMAFLLVLPLVRVSVAAQAGGDALRVAAVDAARPEHLEFLLVLPGDTPVPPDAGEFQLLEDGREAGSASSVQPFRAAGWSLSTVLAVDTSGSLRRYIADVASTLPDVVVPQPPEDAFAVLTFDDDVRVIAPFGTSREEVRDSLRGLAARGRGTRFYGAVESGIATLDALPRERALRRMIVISDGADESGDRPAVSDALIKRAADAAIVIDTILVGQPRGATRDTLMRLAERTGGIHGDVTTPARLVEDLRAALERIIAHVNQAVVVAFDRRVDPNVRTSQVAVRMGNGLPSAAINLQVPRSAASEPPPGPPDGQPWWRRMLPRLLLALVLLLFGYAAFRLIVRGRNREVVTEETPILTPPPVVEPRPPRHTVVGAPLAVATPGTQAIGLVLEGIEGPLMGHLIPVPGPEFRIGAAKSNDLQIASDKYLSAKHALIQASKNGWLVVDNGSSNGTFVDRRKIGTSGQELRDGQRLRIGGSEFRIVLGTAGRAAPSPPAAATPATEVPPR